MNKQPTKKVTISGLSGELTAIKETLVALKVSVKVLETNQKWLILLFLSIVAMGSSIVFNGG